MAKLTDQIIRSLQVPEGAKDVQAFDDSLPGFGVRKFAKGHASYFVKYTIGKQQRRKTLGPFVPGALGGIRKAASLVLAQARLGTDVVGDAKKARAEAEKAEQAKKMGELVPIYLALRERGNEYWKALRPRTLVEVSRYLKHAWQPLHDVSVAEITRAMVKERRNEIVGESGAASANRALGALSSFFGWCIDQEHIAGANPTLDIKPLHEEDRTRVLSEAELVEIWRACNDDDFGCIIRLLMLTGQRRLEIGHLEWSEIFAAKAQIELPAGRTKNKTPHIVPLSTAALELLRGVSNDGARHVFGRSGGFTNWHCSKGWLDERITARRGEALAHWTIHDLRRSFTTHVNELGFAQPHVTEAILNHISGSSKSGVAGTYNRALYLAERREALEQWGRYLTGLLTVPQSNTREKSAEISTQLIGGTK
jgi:integrase